VEEFQNVILEDNGISRHIQEMKEMYREAVDE
jgi:hypothetical protein